jgi:hypothetical protein
VTPPCKASDLIAISADGHGTPAAPVSSGIVTEEKFAVGICAHAQAHDRTFHDKFGSGTRNRCKKPIKTSLAGDEFQLPHPEVENQLVVSFRNAKNLVNRLYPFSRQPFFPHHRAECLPQTVSESNCA